MTPSLEVAAGIVAFWEAAGPERWFSRNEAFDEKIRERYLALHERAARGELDGWREEREGALALLLLLDQFPRNLFRGQARAFACDAKALEIARSAVAQGFDMAYDKPLRTFFYLPWMHSERLEDQRRCVELSRNANEATQRAALQHLDIIERFGRFPHRNPALGRQTTAEEAAFLALPDSFRG